MHQKPPDKLLKHENAVLFDFFVCGKFFRKHEKTHRASENKNKNDPFWWSFCLGTFHSLSHCTCVAIGIIKSTPKYIKVHREQQIYSRIHGKPLSCGDCWIGPVAAAEKLPFMRLLEHLHGKFCGKCCGAIVGTQKDNGKCRNCFAKLWKLIYRNIFCWAGGKLRKFNFKLWGICLWVGNAFDFWAK